MAQSPYQFKAVRFKGEKQFQQFGRITKEMRKAYAPFRKEYLGFIKKLVLETKMELFYAQEWEPLTPNYLARKMADPEQSTQIWKAYNHILKAITGHISRNTIYVGVKAEQYHPYRDGINMATIVKYMEEGTSKMVARPIIGPILERVTKKLERERIYRAYRLLFHVKKKGFVTEDD